jgi:signal peptidase I
MRLKTVRSRLITATLLVVAVVGWVYLAPTEIGGSTSYVITHGTSMEPLFHTGDLALVRPSADYRVGQVVAYHSSLLHTVVLHRIIRREGSGYVFKGDNNSFIDPTRPTRAQLIGRLWLRIPHGGVVLGWLHTPSVAAVLTGAMAMLLLLGTEGERRRRDRGRKREGGAVRPGRQPVMTSVRSGAGPHVKNEHLFAACAVLVVVSAIVSLVAFARATTESITVQQPYSQQLSFGYGARVPAGLIYPSGIVSTGDPIYAQLVHRLVVAAAYHLAATEPHHLRGTIRMVGTLANTSGWSRTIQLAAPRQFAADEALTTVSIDVPQLQTLAAEVSSQIGDGLGDSYTFTITPRVKLSGEIAGQPVRLGFNESLSFQLGAPQLVPAVGATPSTSSSAVGQQQGLNRTEAGEVTSYRTAENTLVGVRVSTVRWLAIVALVVAAGLAWLTGRRGLRTTSDPAEQIKARYRRLIVPISGVTPDPARPPIEVTSMEALGLLAERSERLILHDHRDGVDSYLIDDQGTLYRYRAVRSVDAGGDAGRCDQRNGRAAKDAGRMTVHDRAVSRDVAAGVLEPVLRSRAGRSDEAVEARAESHAAPGAGSERESTQRSRGMAVDASSFWPYAHAAGDDDGGFGGGVDAQGAGHAPVLMFDVGNSWPDAASSWPDSGSFWADVGSIWAYAEASVVLPVGAVKRSPEPAASRAGEAPAPAGAELSYGVQSPPLVAQRGGPGERRDDAGFEHRQHSRGSRQAAVRLAVAFTASAVTWRLLRTAAARTGPRRHAAAISG